MLICVACRRDGSRKATQATPNRVETGGATDRKSDAYINVTCMGT